MGDMGDIWRSVKEAGKEKRAANRESSPCVLTRHGITFESKSLGAHLIVRKPGGQKVDFWPGTGKWIDRASNRKGRGVFPLIKFVRPAQEAAQ